MFPSYVWPLKYRVHKKESGFGSDSDTNTLNYNKITLRKRNARHRKHECLRLVSKSDNLCKQPFDYLISRQSTNQLSNTVNLDYKQGNSSIKRHQLINTTKGIAIPSITLNVVTVENNNTVKLQGMMSFFYSWPLKWARQLVPIRR
jgi:hypothetical protein